MSGTKGKKKDARLLGDSGDEEGVENPAMEHELTHTSGTESSPELEAAEADALVKTLKKKRTRKKKELAKDLISPKDDLARELKEDKKKIREKLDETQRQEEEETRRSLEVADDGTLPMPEVAEDGTLPMPDEETEETPASPKPEEEPAKQEEEEESPIKKLRKKKEKVEETPIEEAPISPPPEEEKVDVPADEPPETERKTPRMASLREKMRDRLKKAKEEAVSEIKEQEKETRRERRLQRDKVQTTRFDTDMEAEELERLTESRRMQREQRKKKMAIQKKEGLAMPTQEESYDFFTRIWEDEEEEKEEVKEKADTEVKEKAEGEEEDKPEGEEAGEGEEGERKPGTADDEQPLIPEGEDEFESFGIIVNKRAEYPDPTEIIKKEEQIYFYPSVSTIPATDKIQQEMEVRRLEEEGFYVGTKPSTSGWNQNRMEHRILKEVEYGHETSRNWFGEDGKLLALPDPLKVLPSRPPVSEEEEPYLQTVFKKALIREFNNRYIDGSTDGGGQYQLDVDINQIHFSHHHMFSREHVLATRLTQLYEQYVIRLKKNITEYLAEKLKALKNSALHLQDHIAAHRSEHSLADNANYNRRLQDYKYEIRQSRMMRDREELADRLLLKNIIHTWKEIKAQRDLQNYNNTPVKLQVRKEEVDKTSDTFIWKQEIEDEIEELRDEYERQHKHKMLTYEEEMAKYQKQQQAKKEAEKRRQKKRGRRGSKQSRGSAASAAPSDEITEEQLEKDEEILNEADLPQPEPPEAYDENIIRQEVTEKAKTQRRRPGEPKLHLELSNTATITPTTACPIGEQRRRNDVSKCKVFVKVLFNNKEVCRTAAKPISQDFKVNFGQIYNLKIFQWPESIKFQVHESVGLGNHLMAELYAPIPDTSVTSQSVQIEDLEFSSDNRINHNHEGVGSGLPFTFGKDAEVMILMTTGIVSFSVAWAVNENGVALVPPSASSNVNNLFHQMKKMDPVAAIGAAGVMDLKKLADWFADSRLDPNDPQNSDIVYMLRGRSGDAVAQLSPAEYFRLEQLMKEFDFAEEDDLKDNRRFQLLQLRDEEVQEFRNYKMVPLYEREIPRDTFVEYEKKKREEQKLKRLEDVDIESHRAAVKRFRQKIREQVMRRFRQQAHMKRFEDMVYEEAVPNVAMLGTNLLKLTERKTKLKPRRKERKKVTAQNIKGDEVKILININRAQNIPIRLSGIQHEYYARVLLQAAAVAAAAKEADKHEEDYGKSFFGRSLLRGFFEPRFNREDLRRKARETHIEEALQRQARMRVERDEKIKQVINLFSPSKTATSKTNLSDTERSYLKGPKASSLLFNPVQSIEHPLSYELSVSRPSMHRNSIIHGLDRPHAHPSHSARSHRSHQPLSGRSHRSHQPLSGRSHRSHQPLSGRSDTDRRSRQDQHGQRTDTTGSHSPKTSEQSAKRKNIPADIRKTISSKIYPSDDGVENISETSVSRKHTTSSSVQSGRRLGSQVSSEGTEVYDEDTTDYTMGNSTEGHTKGNTTDYTTDYTTEGYTEGYTEGNTTGGYSDNTTEGYTSGGYTTEGYTEGYTTEGYTEGYTAEGYTTEGYTEGYTTEGYTTGGYTESYDDVYGGEYDSEEGQTGKEEEEVLLADEDLGEDTATGGYTDSSSQHDTNMNAPETQHQQLDPDTQQFGPGGTMAGRTTEARRKTDTSLVRPFIEIMFQQQTVRTSTCDGPNPSFNEELEIPFKAPHDDYSPSNLQTVGDCIFLNLFDEVVVDIQEDDREKGTLLHQRIEKKWLGSLKIPFTTVYFNGKIDGTFAVDAPPVLLGYSQDLGPVGDVDIGVDKDVKTLLGLFITIEPPLTQPEPAKERFSTNEDEKLMVYADQWMTDIVARFTPRREVKTFVTDTNFKSVFITRYFSPIKPPEDITSKGLGEEALSNLLARYVSLIPFVSDSMIFPGLCDIWNTCDQFLQMLSGDEEEHAILLVNFFLAIGKKAWLICGTAIPEGPTAYVLTEEGVGHWIWNPSSGEHFKTTDVNCPLQSIGCLVNHENIWANIQQYDKPSQIMYRLEDTACWETVFNRSHPYPGLGSIQPDSLYYFPTDKDYVTELQEKIQSVLKNKIMDWRSRYITRWNRHCTQIMRKMLPILEENCGKSVPDQHINELEQSFSTYKVSGFPINMAFTEMEPIVDQVYATGVHAQESSDVEFALAVYVHPYPNSVLSVWVYVASLMRLR